MGNLARAKKSNTAHTIARVLIVVLNFVNAPNLSIPKHNYLRISVIWINLFLPGRIYNQQKMLYFLDTIGIMLLIIQKQIYKSNTYM